MPKLSKARFVHLEYNWKKSVVSDLTLDFRSENTLLKMENGGGKSVMTQMLLSAYLPARKRNFNNRPFADYFSGTQPTFLLQEWSKDDDAGFFCVGQMIHQSTSAKEEDGADEDRRLDHFAWIAEYQKQDDPLSIEAMPLIGTDAKGRKVHLKYSEGKTLLEKLTKEKPAVFRLYNISYSAQRKAYMERLEHLGLRQSEMIQLRDFNQEESGISTFNKTFNTEDKLIRRVLIPAVVQRMDADAGADAGSGHVEMFRESFLSLLEEQKRNRDNLNLVDILRSMRTDLEEIHQFSLSRSLEQKELEKRLKDLRLFYEQIARSVSELENDIAQQDEILAECRKEIVSINHQLLSIEYHNTQAALDDQEKQCASRKEQLESLNGELEDLEQESKLLKCAGVRYELDKARHREKSAEEKLKAARMDAEQIVERQNGYGAALAGLYAEDAQAAQNSLEQSEQEKKQTQQAIDQSKAEQKTLKKVIAERIAQKASLQEKLNTYQAREKSFLSRYSLHIAHSLSFWQDLDAYRALKNTLEDAKQNAQSVLADAEGKLADCQSQQKSYEEAIHTCTLQLQDFTHQKADALRADSELQAKLALRKRFAALCGVSENDLWNDRQMEQGYSLARKRIMGLLDQSNRKISDLERELRQLNTGTALELSEDIRQVLDELGIEERTGAKEIRSWKMAPRAKEAFVREHPIFPYALIVDDDKIDALVRELGAREMNTSMPIPLLSREALNQPEQISGTMQFYVHFNTKLMFESQLKILKENAEQEIQDQKTFCQGVQNDLSELDGTRARVNEEPISQKDLENSRKRIAMLEESIAKTGASLQSAQIDLENEKNREKTLRTARDGAKKEFEHAKSACMEMDELLKAYMAAAAVHEQLCQAIDQLEKDQHRQVDLESRIENLTQTKTLLAERIVSQKAMRDVAKSRADEFARFESFVPVKGERIELEAAFASLQLQLDQSQCGLFEQQRKEAHKARCEKQTALDKLFKVYGLSNEDLEYTAWSLDAELENEYQTSDLRDKIGNLEKEISKQKENIARLQAIMESLIGRIQEATGQDEPLERSQIRSGDLKAEQKQTSAWMKQTEETRAGLFTKKTDFENLSKRVLDMKGVNEAELNEDDLKQMSQKPAFAHLSLNDLEGSFNSYRVAYQNQEDSLSKLRRELGDTLDGLQRRYSAKNEICQKILEAIALRMDDIEGFKEEVEQKQTLLENLLASIETNLQKLESKKEEVEKNLFGYLRTMHTQLKSIDSNTTIRFGNVPRKMLEIVLPDWDEHEALYKETLRQYLQDALLAMEKQDVVEDSKVYSYIRPENLYNSVVGISNVRIRLYKIEEHAQTRIYWREAGSISGAEGFLCALTVILAVLNYQHKTSADLVGSRKDTSLLLLDNPFAYTQSAHIIDAMMKLAHNMHTQMVAFTNVDNAAILSAFSNIYVLRMVSYYDNRLHMESTKVTPDEVREAEPVQMYTQEGSLFDIDMESEDSDDVPSDFEVGK